MRKIVVDFIISSDKTTIDSIAERINIEPHYSRSEFPEKSIAKPYWYIETVSDSASVEEPLLAIMDTVTPKFDIVSEICRELGSSPTILLIIDSDYENRPEITIPSEFAGFCARLNAELCIDITNDW